MKANFWDKKSQRLIITTSRILSSKWCILDYIKCIFFISVALFWWPPGFGVTEALWAGLTLGSVFSWDGTEEGEASASIPLLDADGPWCDNCSTGADGEHTSCSHPVLTSFTVVQAAIKQAGRLALHWPGQQRNADGLYYRWSIYQVSWNGYTLQLTMIKCSLVQTLMQARLSPPFRPTNSLLLRQAWVAVTIHFWETNIRKRHEGMVAQV